MAKVGVSEVVPSLPSVGNPKPGRSYSSDLNHRPISRHPHRYKSTHVKLLMGFIRVPALGGKVDGSFYRTIAIKNENRVNVVFKNLERGEVGFFNTYFGLIPGNG